jgi:hypothetical protein
MSITEEILVIAGGHDRKKTGLPHSIECRPSALLFSNEKHFLFFFLTVVSLHRYPRVAFSEQGCARTSRNGQADRITPQPSQ